MTGYQMLSAQQPTPHPFIVLISRRNVACVQSYDICFLGLVYLDKFSLPRVYTKRHHASQRDPRKFLSELILFCRRDHLQS